MKKGKELKKSGISIEKKKTIAKYGMSISLGILVTTGLAGSNSQTMKKIHLLTGAGLIGFSFWHNSLYPSKKKKA